MICSLVTAGRGDDYERSAGFGVAPKRTFLEVMHSETIVRTRKVRDGEDTIASTRDVCATQFA